MTAPVPAEHGSGRPWRQWLQPPAALVLALLWIVALGAGAHLPTGLAFAVLALVAATFWACHIYQERPRGWHYGRLVRPAAHWLPWALGMVLALTAWRVLAAAELSRVGVLAPAALQAKVTAWTAVAAVLVAPLVEEFGFRLWLQSALERVLPFALALLLASIAFALIHEPTLALLHAASGLLYGVALRASGSIWLSVGMHALANAIIALAALNAEHLPLWNLAQQLSPAAAMVSLALLTAGLWLGARRALSAR